jgi:hypothetical protein
MTHQYKDWCSLEQYASLLKRKLVIFVTKGFLDPDRTRTQAARTFIKIRTHSNQGGVLQQVDAPNAGALNETQVT